MGSNLSCFDWGNIAAEYLDGSLAPGLKKNADLHLSECRECSERHQHYRLILESLRSLPRASTPTDLQHELDLESPRRTQINGISFLKTWKSIESALKTPRTITIGTSILASLIALGALPKLRAIYEQRLQKRLEASNFAELPLSAQSAESLDPSIDEFISEDIEEDDEGSEGAIIEASTQNGSASRSASPQVWRFILKTDSPQELRAKIHESLLGAGALAGSRFLNGFAAPGGIQFDALIPADQVDQLKEQLATFVDQQVLPDSEDESKGAALTSPFKWYKNRSKRPLPAGAARVVIWISLI